MSLLAVRATVAIIAVIAVVAVVEQTFDWAHGEMLIVEKENLSLLP